MARHRLNAAAPVHPARAGRADAIGCVQALRCTAAAARIEVKDSHLYRYPRGFAPAGKAGIVEDRLAQGTLAARSAVFLNLIRIDLARVKTRLVRLGA